MKLQIAFYKGRKRWLNRLVSWWLNGPYSHCELILATDASGVSTCASSSYLDGGVRIKLMALDPEHWDLVPVEGDALKAWDWIAIHENEGYDLMGLLGFIWRRHAGAGNRWFCTEAVASMLGWPEPWRIDPMALWVAVAGQADLYRDSKGMP